MKRVIENIYNKNPEFKVISYNNHDVNGLNIFTEEAAVIQCTAGKAEIILNSQHYTLNKGTNFMIRRSHHLQFLKANDSFSVRVFDFSFSFFSLVYHILDKKIFDTLYLYNSPNICSSKELSMSNITLNKINSLFTDTTHTNRMRYLVSLTVSYMIERYDAHIRCSNTEETERDNEVSYYVSEFRLLCDKMHTKERDIKVYAKRIGISPRHLYEVVKKATTLSPKQIVTNYVIATAKRLLLTSTLTTQEIALKLNYEEQANFSQFFKRYVGVTPTEFRKTYYKINSK